MAVASERTSKQFAEGPRLVNPLLQYVGELFTAAAVVLTPSIRRQAATSRAVLAGLATDAVAVTEKDPVTIELDEGAEMFTVGKPNSDTVIVEVTVISL